MSLPMTLPTAQRASMGTWLIRAVAVAMTIAMMLYGVIAIDAGTTGVATSAAKRSPGLGS